MELILAGASFYVIDDVVDVINQFATDLRTQNAMALVQEQVTSFGRFSLREIDSSWSRMLMLGAIDFYGTNDIRALQLVPDQTHWTIDVPKLNEAWDPLKEPIWQWLQEPWRYAVSPQATGVTNLAALRGERITEVMRWEEDQWELFAGAGPDVPWEELRVVQVGTLLASDRSLEKILGLPVGGGCWRDHTLVWHPWSTANQA